jgi:hypothetical protein
MQIIYNDTPINDLNDSIRDKLRNNEVYNNKSGFVVTDLLEFLARCGKELSVDVLSSTITKMFVG